MKSLGNISREIVNSIQQTESPIEQLLFRELQRTPPFVLCRHGIDQPVGEGYFFFPQAVIEKYRLDFLILGVGYFPGSRVWPPRLRGMLAVECDGADHHSAPEDVEYDRLRDSFFLQKNIRTLRLSGSAILNNPEFCVQEIIHHLQIQMKKNG